MSFDVWGDTVNLASRAEQNSWPGQITITQNVVDEISNYFDIENRGLVEIKKRGGNVHMYFLQFIKDEHCLYGEGIQPSTALRLKCGLVPVDFNAMRNDILNRLKTSLPEGLEYHDVNHTINVEKAAHRLAKLEGLNEEDTLILRTAALYHDAGFIFQFHHNEKQGILMARKSLPRFGYSEEQIEIIAAIINSTRTDTKASNILEELMSDADHDYFGRADYHTVAKGLRNELKDQGVEFNELSWIDFQLAYLDGRHRYYSDASKNIRLPGKKRRITELKKKRITLSE